MTTSRHRFRRTLIGVEAFTAIAAAGGAVSMLIGQGTPPISDLEPLGLTSWVLPGLWLFASVTVPSSVAAWLAYRRSPRTPVAVLVASALLGVELLVQIPFVGPSVLQAVMGTIAVAMAVLAGIGWHTWRVPTPVAA